MPEQRDETWLKSASAEAIAVAQSQGSLDVLLGVRELADGEGFEDPKPPVQRDEKWLGAHKSDTNEIVRAMGAGELNDLLGSGAL